MLVFFRTVRGSPTPTKKGEFSFENWKNVSYFWDTVNIIFPSKKKCV